MANSPVLLIEGDGDRSAVPALLRRIAHEQAIFDLTPAPRPIRVGNVPKIQRQGVLEKFISYALIRSDADSVLLILDCDDGCPAELASSIVERASPIVERYEKAMAIAFMKKEFESLFLFSLETIAFTYSEYGWILENYNRDFDFEQIRGCKERLNSFMRSKKYKETRDQVKFVSALDIEVLLDRSRSFQHLCNSVAWLSDSANQPFQIYPNPWVQPDD